MEESLRRILENVSSFFRLNFENRFRLFAGQGRCENRTGSIWGKNGPTKAEQGRVGPNVGGGGVPRLGVTVPIRYWRGTQRARQGLGSGRIVLVD